MKNLKTSMAALLLSTLCSFTSAYGQLALSGVSPLVVEPIDESKRILLPGNTPARFGPSSTVPRSKARFP